MHHRLAQIAADGSQKLPVRILPVLRAERAAGPACPRARPGCSPRGCCHLRGRRRAGRRRPRRPDGRARGRSAARRGPPRARRAWTRPSARTTSWSRPCSRTPNSASGTPGRPAAVSAGTSTLARLRGVTSTRGVRDAGGREADGSHRSSPCSSPMDRALKTSARGWRDGPRRALPRAGVLLTATRGEREAAGEGGAAGPGARAR